MNDFLDYAIDHQFGELHLKVDPKTGMKTIIAIHSTKLGPALGGCRFIEYPHTEAALYDAMRLARGMSYKAALAQLPLGGGKAVIIKPQHTFNRTDYFHRFGQFVQDLGGRYITALDSGTQLSDMDIIAEHTPFVASLSCHEGDPSPSTAKGIFRGIQAAVQFKLGKESLRELHIAVQGLGHVGFLLCELLNEQGVRLSVADIDPIRVEQACKAFGATAISSEDIHKIPCDVFSPCALGAVVNDESIKAFQTTIIAGAANNQLAHTYHGQQLHDLGILYAPDYVINTGGLLFAANKYLQTSTQQLHEQLDRIYTLLIQIFSRSMKEQRACSDIADDMAQEILAS